MAPRDQNPKQLKTKNIRPPVSRLTPPLPRRPKLMTPEMLRQARAERARALSANRERYTEVVELRKRIDAMVGDVGAGGRMVGVPGLGGGVREVGEEEGLEEEMETEETEGVMQEGGPVDWKGKGRVAEVEVGAEGTGYGDDWKRKGKGKGKGKGRAVELEVGGTGHGEGFGVGGNGVGERGKGREPPRKKTKLMHNDDDEMADETRDESAAHAEEDEMLDRFWVTGDVTAWMRGFKS